MYMFPPVTLRNAILLLSLLPFLFACSPANIRSGGEPNSAIYHPVQVLFVTDRAVSTEEDTALFYSDRRGVVGYGRALVDIPAEATIKETQRRWWMLPAYGNRRIADARIERVELLTRAEFMTAVEKSETAPESKPGTVDDQSLLFYVHGYNTGFEEAILRTAQLRWDTGHRGQAVLFTWPSTISIAAYAADEVNVEWATPHLTALLTDIKLQTEVSSINLIGHSMGTRALTHALIDVESSYGNFQSVKHLVMAAPDIDTDIFKRDIAPMVVAPGRRVTLYASSRDRALDISRQLHRHPRAGDAESGVVVFPGIDTIDVTAVDSSFLGHNYYGESQSIVRDMRQLFLHDHAPASRERLQAVSSGDGQYWKMLPAQSPSE